MKKTLLNLTLVFGLVFLMSSCYTYTFDVGEGAQTAVKKTAKNHYFINGLAAGNISDPFELAEGEEDFTVTVQFTFIDGLINALTFGIYTPTTTTVQK